MSRKKPTPSTPPTAVLAPASAATASDHEALYGRVRDVLAQARRLAHRQVNQSMVLAYWNVGRLIVEYEQAGQARAAYGTRLLPALAQRLTAEFGPGFAEQSLRNFRQLYQVFGSQEIRSTPWSELSWSHLKTLMRVAEPDARRWYATEAVSQAWGVAALDRQIGTLYYERLLSSQDKAAVQAEAQALVQRDARPDPRDFIRDPYVLDFLGAQPGKLSHQDVGQMDIYVRVWDERQRSEGDGPTIGLILSSERNDAVARYSRLADGGPLYASRYQAWLPTEAELQAELARDRALWELGQAEGEA